MKTYIVGDLHLRKEEPFFEAGKKLLEYLKSILLPKDILIFVGDVFHYSKPAPKENKVFIDFLLYCLENKIQVEILAGNHDWNGYQGTFSIDPLDGIANLHHEPFKFVSANKSAFIMLPWLSPYQIKEISKENITMKDFYMRFCFENSDMKDLLKKNLKEVDDSHENIYFLYHFPDETVDFGGVKDGIDLSGYQVFFENKIKRIGGDIHLQSNNYIGTPYQTRYDERGQKGRIYCVKEEGELEVIDLPSFLEYVDIDYSEEVLEEDSLKILTIKNAPSISAAKEKFRDFHIRVIETENSYERIVIESEGVEDIQIKDLFKEFTTINVMDESTKKYLESIIF